MVFKQDTRKRKFVGVRLTEAEYHLLEQNAEEQNTTLSDAIRRKIRGIEKMEVEEMKNETYKN